MSMAHILFVRDFEAEIDAERRLAERAAPIYGEDDLATATDAARAEGHAAGFAEGHHAGLQEALDRIETQAAAAMETLSAAVTVLLDDRAAHRQRLEAEMVAFAGDLAGRVLPEAVDRLGPIRLKQELARIIRRAAGSPSLVIRLSPDVAARLTPELTALGATSGQTVHVQPDPALHPAEALAEWRHGRSRYSFAAICRSVLGLIRQSAPVPHSPEPVGADHD